MFRELLSDQDDRPTQNYLIKCYFSDHIIDDRTYEGLWLGLICERKGQIEFSLSIQKLYENEKSREYDHASR